jgi:hypothetical protein
MKRKRYKPFPFSKIKMSDPYAGTVTVRNILNHIISPKIVSDGSGGYTTRVDLVNVDRLVLNSGTGDGTVNNPFTGQFGFIGSVPSGIGASLYHRDVTPSSVILTSLRILGVANGSFEVANDTSGPVTTATWFIVKF